MTTYSCVAAGQSPFIRAWATACWTPTLSLLHSDELQRWDMWLVALYKCWTFTFFRYPYVCAILSLTFFFFFYSAAYLSVRKKRCHLMSSNIVRHRCFRFFASVLAISRCSDPPHIRATEISGVPSKQETGVVLCFRYVSRAGFRHFHVKVKA